MNKQSPNKRPSRQTTLSEVWSQYLQRRIMRLLFLHDQQLFRGQFRTFFTGSSLPKLPLLQFYDDHLKLLMFSDELLDDILPRIRRQLSLQTDKVSLQEEAPTRGEIDWPSTITRTINETPDQPPLRFDTNQRKQHTGVPENLLFIALLLQHQHMVQDTLKKDQINELLTDQERQRLVSIDERLERELAAPYARTLTGEASRNDIDTLVEQVATRLRPGVSPYRDLLMWWEQFSSLRIGLANESRHLVLADNRRNEQIDNYELWLALEMLTLLQEKHLLDPDTLEIQIDKLRCTFAWDKRRYHFHYQRRLSPPTGSLSGWEQVPALQSGSIIEREQPLEITHGDTIIWREPPFVMSAAYTTGGNTEAHLGAAIQEILGSMQLRSAYAGALFFPFPSAAPADRQFTSEIKRDRQIYTNGATRETSISLYKIAPDIPTTELQEQLFTVIQHAVTCLPEREKPACHGVVLDPDSINASQDSLQMYNILCPKPHIDKGVFDLVNREKHCLKDPHLCHIIGQAILPPRVERVNNLNDLKQHVHELRTYAEEALNQAEKDGGEDKAEQLRTQILNTIGNMVDQYIRTKGAPPIYEANLELMFKIYWKQKEHCLAEETRNILISGEYVWREYEGAKLEDWAAPAIQYYRALERELKRRLYEPDQGSYTIKTNSWTLGTYKHLYEAFEGKPQDKKALTNWNGLIRRSKASGTDEDKFIGFMQSMINENIFELRNKLAHGDRIDQQTAKKIRVAILGQMQKNEPGMLHWVIEHLSTKK